MQIKTTVLLTKTTNNSVDIKINDLKMKNAIFHILPQLKLECLLNVTVVVSKSQQVMMIHGSLHRMLKVSISVLISQDKVWYMYTLLVVSTCLKLLMYFKWLHYSWNVKQKVITCTERTQNPVAEWTGRARMKEGNREYWQGKEKNNKDKKISRELIRFLNL